MLRATLRNLLAHKLRLLLSALAIVLGVAFVSGTFIFTDTLSRTFNDLFRAVAADVTVEPRTAFDAGLSGTGPGAAPAVVPASVLETVRRVEGTAAAEGSVNAQGVYLLGKDGKPLQTGGAPGIGVSWTTNEELRPLTMVQGRPPNGPGEVAIDTVAAKKAGYSPGDRVSVLTPGPRLEATVSGVFRFGNTGGLAGASLTAFDLPTAQRVLLGGADGFSDISVQAATGTEPQTLRDRVAAAVGPNYQVQTGEENAEEQAAQLEQGLQFVNIFLLVFAAVALFVGSFLILNTFSMLVAQRTRELALLRALGAARSQVTGSVLLEALFLGLLGSVLGLAAGFGVAALLRALFGAFGLTLDGNLTLTARTPIAAFLVGTLVTLLAAVVPAWRGSRIPPVAAMREEAGWAGSQSRGSRGLRWRAAIGVVLVSAGLVGVGVAFTQELANGIGAAYAGAGGWALILGAIVLAPVLIRPFARTVGAALPRIWGTTGALARENAMRNPRRTAATASALMIGLALVSAFSVMGASTRASVDTLIDRTVGADYVVTSTFNNQSFSPQVAADIRAVPGVASVTPQRFAVARIRGEEERFTAVDATTVDAGLRLKYLAGSSEGLAEDGILINADRRVEQNLEPGSSVEVLLPNGNRRTLTVRGVYEKSQAVGPYVIAVSTYEAMGGNQQDNFVYVNAADDADLSQVRSGLEAAVAAYPIVNLHDRNEFKAENRSQVDQLLLIIYALLVLSVIIAILGIVNTLALSVMERTREIGLLRAIGMQRRQLRRMIRLESVLISVFGAALGLAIGVLFGAALVRGLSGQGIETLLIPWGQLALFLLAGALVGVLAAAWPARRAARMSVLDAVATS